VNRRAEWAAAIAACTAVARRAAFAFHRRAGLVSRQGYALSRIVPRRPRVACAGPRVGRRRTLRTGSRTSRGSPERRDDDPEPVAARAAG
jgi:hypothetical protein